MTERQEKILGGLLAAAVGDSMGAVTEHASRKKLKKEYGWVTTFLEPHARLKANGHKIGLVTDDFSVAYYSALPLVEHHCKVNRELAIEGLLRWNEQPLYAQCAGPTTITTINQLKGIPTPPRPQDALACDNSRVTNGGGMKSGMMGLFNPGDVSAAIDDTIVLCGLTHDNTIAIAAACAIAAATAKAFCPGASYLDLIEAGIYGAEEGYRRALGRFRPVAASNIAKRIALAAEIGLARQDDQQAAMEEIADLVGCGLFAHESIPAAFGYIAAAKGQVMDSLYMAINAGDDTDTVACMTGFITGAYCSVTQLPQSYLELIDRVNGFDLAAMAAEIDAITREAPAQRQGCLGAI